MVGYLTSKPSLWKINSGTIYPIAKGMNLFITFPKVLVWSERLASIGFGT